MSQLGRELGLSTDQIKFCEAWCSHENHGSNGKEAAAIAYGYDLSKPKEKQSAYNTANRNLKHPQVNLLISILLSTTGLNDNFVDKRLMEIIQQNADQKTAVMAIAEYNKVQNRVKQTIEIITPKQIFDHTAFSADELSLFITLMKKGLIQGQQASHLNLIEDHHEKED